MKLIIANSKNWFKINKKIENKHEIAVVTNPKKLNLRDEPLSLLVSLVRNEFFQG